MGKGQVEGPVNSIVVFAVNDLSRFNGAIQDRFNLVRFTYPDERERREFLERKIRKAGKHIDIAIDRESMVRMTEEMSFRTIEKAWNQAVYAFLETGKAISTDDFSGYLKEATSLEKQEAAEMFG